MRKQAWQGFKKGNYEREIDVRDFIINNYTPYEGDDQFLVEASAQTKALWQQVLAKYQDEREAGGVLDIDVNTIATIDAHGAGYINKDLEVLTSKKEELIKWWQKQEEGEAKEQKVVDELIAGVRRDMRNFSPAGGLRDLVKFPFSSTRERRRGKE